MKRSKCPLCHRRAEDTMTRFIKCSHTRLSRLGYWSPDGKFYLSNTASMRKQAAKDGLDPEPFIEKTS